MQPIILAEILRNGRVESRHYGAFVVTDAAGRGVVRGGDIEAAVFPRSAIKALQALPLVASGAAEALGLTQAELALACASHGGTPAHAATAASMLAKAGRDVTCLECGAHWPSSSSAARALAAAGQVPSALHNNCSGKHAGFICAAVAAGQDPTGYIGPDHPTMRQVTQAVAATTGARLGEENRGTDGCSIPTFAIPLRSIATGFARFGSGQSLPAGFAEAGETLRSAVAAHPAMVAGEGWFDTVVMRAHGRDVFVKTGAEGVYAGALPGLGLGFAVKAEDGAARAAELATAALLRHFLGASETLDRLTAPVLKNWNGIEVGSLRPALHLPQDGGDSTA
jgi:L-asparaginase II